MVGQREMKRTIRAETQHLFLERGQTCVHTMHMTVRAACIIAEFIRELDLSSFVLRPLLLAEDCFCVW